MDKSKDGRHSLKTPTKGEILILNMDIPGTGVASGPFPEGFQKFMGLWSVMIPDVYWKREHTLLCSNDKFNGAPHVFLSKFDATMNEVPEGFDEFPMFPGIDPEKIKGKRFETLGIVTNKMSIIAIFGHNVF